MSDPTKDIEPQDEDAPEVVAHSLGDEEVPCTVENHCGAQLFDA